MFRPLAAITALAGLTLLTLSSGLGQTEREPAFVGARVCGSCHEGPGMGHQFSKWLLSKHAQAYAVLATPAARKIAELSGIPGEPQQAFVCMGCHATAADTEEWERDETFLIEDGVQCERCHGPGSEYISAEVMQDPQAAAEAGLIRPTPSTCRVCHFEKGSHRRVLEDREWQLETAWLQISHPKPTETYLSVAPVRAEFRAGEGPKIAGVKTCMGCHDDNETGSQFSHWRLGPHSRAFARLATPKAYEIAQEEGLVEVPQASEACLRCHTTVGGTDAEALPTFTLDEGVGCEACHGPGSEHISDQGEAPASRIPPTNSETCMRCHNSAHGKPFDLNLALQKVRHPLNPAHSSPPQYKTPLNLALSPDSRELLVTCEASGSVIVIDVDKRRKVDEISVGGQPHDVTFRPDGAFAYVSNRLDDTVSVINVRTREVIQSIPVGDEPHGLLTNQSGKTLFVLNSAQDSISLIDTSDLVEIMRLSASRNPWSLALSPDGGRLLITNTLSRLVGFREPQVSEITGVNTNDGTVSARLVVPDANLLQGIAWHPQGEFAFFTLTRTKNLVPMTRLLQGWTVTNGLGIAWKNGRVDQVLLDEPNLAFPDPTDVAFVPDGHLALVTSSGSDRVAVLDVARLLAMLKDASEEERKNVFPNHLGKPTEFIVKHIPTPKSPRGLAITPDGTTAFVANSLDDSVTVIDVTSLESVQRIDLGGPKEVTEVRWGEQLFHSANITFQRQFSCHTCHPDGHVDGLTFDIQPDGIGVSPVDNRSLRGILDTAPFKWEGTNPNLRRQCGPRLAVFFTRIQPFTEQELSALEDYLAVVPRPPNRYRPLGSPLTAAQRRGKKLFERTRKNDGSLIASEKRCIGCHPPPLYTNHQIVDVGTKMPLDREGRFDIPHLTNVYDSAPYLHNGIARTLEEIWTVYNPNDLHGVTNDLTKDQLNDLIEYVKTF